MTNPNAFNALIESIQLSRDKTDRYIQSNTEALDRLTESVSSLAASIKAQSANMDRLERAVTRMVESNEGQRETVNNLIRLATALVERQAS